MNYLTQKLINEEDLEILINNLKKKDLPWEDGKKTAGTHASKVKNNLQLKRNSEISQKYSQLISRKILNNSLIKSFCLPKHIHGTMFTKSVEGMKYGRHIDNGFMSSGRADLSFTLFLSRDDQYKGGELVIENIHSENKFKLKSGEILIYPSSYLHSVNEVLYGERLVFVGWIESYVKSIELREYLFDLDAGARTILANHGESEALDLIFKSYTNLLRLLGN